MKVTLEKIEIEEAIKRYIKSEYLKDYDKHEFEDLEMLDSGSLIGEISCNVNVVKVAQTSPAPAVAPMPAKAY